MLQRLRVFSWYLALKSKCDWSDYKLDVTFCLPGAVGTQDYAARPRTFEKIRKFGVVPERGSSAKRGFDLIEEVDRHPEFQGTKDIYESPFWELLDSAQPTLVTANEFVNKLLLGYGLMRIESEIDLSILAALRDRHGPTKELEQYFHLSDEDRFEYWLSHSLRKLPSDLDRITLLGALFREAYLGMSLKIAALLKNQLVDHLDRFFQVGWATPLQHSLKPLAHRRIIYWAFDPSETLGGWPDPIHLMLESYIVNEKSGYKKVREDPNWRNYCLAARK